MYANYIVCPSWLIMCDPLYITYMHLRTAGCNTVVLWYANIALFSTLRHLNQYLLWHFLPKQTSEILVKSIHYHLEQCFARSRVYIIWEHFQLRLAWKSAESTPKLCQLKIVLKWYGLKKNYLVSLVKSVPIQNNQLRDLALENVSNTFQLMSTEATLKISWLCQANIMH